MRNRNLEERLKGSNWAYTGSVAMKIHANRLGVQFPKNRKIGNVNIAAVYPLDIIPIITSSKRWKLNGPPEHKHTTFYTNNGKKLNLFPANGRLAPKFIHVEKHPGYPPVMSVQSLLNQKRSINMNDVFGNNRQKLKNNITFLKSLQ